MKKIKLFYFTFILFFYYIHDNPSSMYIINGFLCISANIVLANNLFKLLFLTNYMENTMSIYSFFSRWLCIFLKV